MPKSFNNIRYPGYSFSSIASSNSGVVPPLIDEPVDLIELENSFKEPLYRNLLQDLLELSKAKPYPTVESKINTFEPVLDEESSITSREPFLIQASTISTFEPILTDQPKFQ